MNEDNRAGSGIDNRFLWGNLGPFTTYATLVGVGGVRSGVT